MPDTLVLAELTIDSSGVVTGVGVVKDSLGQAEQATDKFGKTVSRNTGFTEKLTERMFSLRHAAVALIGSFSLAGIIFELKGFLEEVIKSDAAFEDLQKSAAALHSEFISIARDGLGISSTLREATQWMDRLSGAILAAQAASPGGKKQGVFQNLFFGDPGISLLLAEFDAIGAAMDKLFAKQIAQIQAARGVGGVSVFEEWQQALKDTEAQLLGLEKGGIGTVAPGFKLIDGVIAKVATRLPDALTALEDASNPLKETWQEMNQFTDEIASGWETADEAIAGIQETDLHSTFKEVSENAQLAASAIVAIGQSITQHIIQGGLTFRSVFADMLMSMVPVLLGLAAIHLLEYDFAGAAYAFAAAIAAASAAKALGAGQQRGYGSQPGGQPALAGASSTVTVVFAGPTFGFNEAAFGRYIMDLQRRGERDNS